MIRTRGDGKGGMTVSETGRKGVERVRDAPGAESDHESGRKGGETGMAERGHEFYEEIGKKGGESVRASRGPEFYSQIGHKGGQKVRELIEQGKRVAKEAALKTEKAVLDELGNLTKGGSKG